MSENKTQSTQLDLESFIRTQQKFLTYYTNITNDILEKLIYSLNCLTEISATILQDKNIFLSFNGGKDCLAAYIILKYYFFCQDRNYDYTEKQSYKAFTEQQSQYKITEKDIYLIYFINENNFEVEEDYVIKFAAQEGLKVLYIYGDYITGMRLLVNKYNVKLIVMGTRKDDVKSYSNEESLLFPSTAPYPEFLRFFPVFNWSYEDVWRLILSSKTSYLSLYDEGYSSIGRKGSSKVNETLRVGDGMILPAWCLEEFITERGFR